MNDNTSKLVSIAKFLITTSTWVVTLLVRISGEIVGVGKNPMG